MNSSHGLNRFCLRAQRIVVTGASQGLGRGIALALAGAEATVIGVARSERGLMETRDLAADLNGRFEGAVADLTEDADLERLVAHVWEERGPITGVIHAAGVQVRKPAVDISRDEWRLVTKIQTEVPFFLSQLIAQRQQANRTGGCHIFIGSLVSWIGRPNVAPYAASKSAALGLTRALAVEWAEFGIRVNAICPGYFRTALNDDLLSDPEQRDPILARIPLRRFGLAEDLAGAAIYLLSEAAGYVTGQVVNVDGGWLAG